MIIKIKIKNNNNNNNNNNNDNFTIKHCDRTKVKTITVKNSKKLEKCFKLFENFKSDDVSTFTQRHFQVKMNKKKLLEFKCTKQILRE